jgi:2-iminobutanoate/2-iminopropanoate deaminase
LRQAILTDKAPKAVGPYSQAIRIAPSGLIFCSGQLSLDPDSGEVVGDTAGEQCRRAMENLSAVLQAAGSSLDRAVKLTLYLSDMGDFAAVNEVYATFFADEPPARAVAESPRLPKGVKLEIDAIAMVD